MTAVDYLFETLWDCPKDKLTWYTILEKAKEMEQKQTHDSFMAGGRSAFNCAKGRDFLTFEEYLKLKEEA